MAAYLIPSQTPENKALHAHGTLTDASPDGSVFSRYGLEAADWGRALTISGMHFKPVQRGTAAGVATATSAVSARAESTLYAIQWQAANILAGLGMRAVSALSARRGIVAAERVGVRERISAESPGAVGGMLQKIQGLSVRGALHIRTRDVHGDRHTGPGGFRVSVASAAAAGLARVVAQEMPTASVTHLDSASASPQTSDGLSGVVDGGLQLTPLLTAMPATRGVAPPRLGIGDGVMVSGGLGDIGSVLTAWVGSDAPGCHLWLLGRSGRGQLAPGLMDADCCITAVACDAASSADMEGARALSCQVALSATIFQPCRSYLQSLCTTGYMVNMMIF
jgi:hypothetical protein